MVRAARFRCKSGVELQGNGRPALVPMSVMGGKRTLGSDLAAGFGNTDGWFGLDEVREWHFTKVRVKRPFEEIGSVLPRL